MFDANESAAVSLNRGKPKTRLPLDQLDKKTLTAKVHSDSMSTDPHKEKD